MKNTNVPIIDVSPLLQPASNNCQATIEEISKACQFWGFFYVTHHNVDSTLVEDIQREGKNFFGLPKKTKNNFARFEGNFQGYSDSELTKQKVDWKEIFDFSSENSFHCTTSASIAKIHGKNQWPSADILPNFQTTLTTYFDEVRRLGLVLMDAIFQGLGSTEETFSPQPIRNPVQEFFSLEEDTSFGRLNNYPVHPTGLEGDKTMTNSQLGVGPHSDAGVLTVLLHEEGVTSLQVKKDGVWHDVPPIKDSFVINIGDMMQVWSNGKYPAPVHRVLTNPTKSRFSLPFFLNPKYSCVVEPLCCKGEDKLYKPILWSEFRAGRVVGDYADVGEELQISHYFKTKTNE